MAKKHKGRSAAFMRSINPHLRHKKAGESMAKRKSGKSYKHSIGAGMSPMKALIGGAVYGVVRKPLTDAVTKFVGGFAANVGEPVIIGVVDWMIAKKTKGIIRDAALMGLGFEAYTFTTSNISLNNLFGTPSTTSLSATSQSNPSLVTLG